jgi:selenocysteine lyase/cysteine desulfurase
LFRTLCTHRYAPEDSESYLDAIFFSPHKFLGPGTCGVLVFNKKLYQNLVPDNPGGGTVSWTNPWEVISMSIILKIGKMVELLVFCR